MVLAPAVARVSGLSFGACLTKECFEPFGMKTAGVRESPRGPTAARGRGCVREDDAWKAWWAALAPGKHEKQLTVGDGGIWASLDDRADGELQHDESDAVVTMSHSGTCDGFETCLGHDIARELTVVVLWNPRGPEAEALGEAVDATCRR